MELLKVVERALADFADPLKRDRYFELYAPEIVLHGYGAVRSGLDSVKQYYAGFWEAIPDARILAEDMVESADKIVLRFTLFGTHRGQILGVDATGKTIQVEGITILRFQEHKCVERWSITDSLALAIQIGAFSSPH